MILRDLAALAVLALVVIWQHWRPILEGGVWLPANGGDLASLIYPNYRFAAESLRSGDGLFWNPYIQGGAPFVADIQSGVLYPVNVVVFLVAPAVTYRVVTALVLFHLWLAGALAYALARGIGLPRVAALLTGVAFGLSDLFVIHVGNLNTIAASAWVPLMVLGALKRNVGLGAVAVAMGALAGHAQPLMFGLLAIALAAVYAAWTPLRRGDLVGIARAGWPGAAIAALGLAAAAIQLGPAAELTGLSSRHAIAYEHSTEYSLAPGMLLSMVVPGFFGRGPDNYWGQWLRSEGGYVGILTLVLAAVALVGRRDAVVRYCALLGCAALLLALGGATALHALFFRFVPLYGSLRGPARHVVLLDLALALLAGIGLALLMRHGRAAERVAHWTRRVWLFVLALVPAAGVMLMLLRENPALPRATGIAEGWIMFAVWLGGAVFLLYARRWRRLTRTTIGALAVGWLALDLVSNSQGLEISRKDPRTAFEHPAIVSFLRRDPEPFRIDTDTGIWDVWQPNTAMVQRIPDVVGGQHPLELADFRRYWSALGSRSSPLYDLMNAKYLIARPGTPLDPKFERVFEGDGGLVVFQNRSARPRAELPGGSARYVPRGTSALAVEIEPTVEASLVVADTWYPGWRAWVDGRAAPIERVEGLFRAVRVRPGDRLVEMRFEPTNWWWWVAISGGSWVAMLLLLSRPWIARFRRARGLPSAS